VAPNYFPTFFGVVAAVVSPVHAHTSSSTSCTMGQRAMEEYKKNQGVRRENEENKKKR
jgi:hypothetical protein